jgi:hypothetical protein
LDRVEVKVDRGFSEVNQTLTTLREQIARREESEKNQWHVIRDLQEKADEVPDRLAEALSAHVEGCPLQDITEVGIKTERRKHGDRGRQETYDTPNGGTRRSHSITPKGKYSLRQMILMGAGVAAVIAALGIWIGVALSTGSSDRATQTIRDLKQQVIQEQSEQYYDPKMIANP